MVYEDGDFDRDGYTILRNVVSEPEADLAAETIDAFYGDNITGRVVNLHMNSARIKNVVANPFVLEWLQDNIFDSPTVYTTLAFKQGTQQPIHRDGPHFVTWPLNAFVGVWYALEDADANNGCVQYYAGGHKIPDIDGSALARSKYPDSIGLNKDQIAVCMDAYQQTVVEDCRLNGLQLQLAEMQKGDVLIWHPLLPHGGSAIRVSGATRRSVVAHCVPFGAAVYNARHFFDPRFSPERLPVIPEQRYEPHHTGWFIQEQPPAFFQKEYV